MWPTRQCNVSYLGPRGGPETCNFHGPIFHISDRTYLRITEQEFKILPLDVSNAFVSCLHTAHLIIPCLTDGHPGGRKFNRRPLLNYPNDGQVQGDSGIGGPPGQVLGDVGQPAIILHVPSPGKSPIRKLFPRRRLIAEFVFIPSTVPNK